MAQGMKAIFVTGGASGIGRAVAERFGKAGWLVGLADVNEAGMAETAALIPSGHSSIHRLDVRDGDQWDKALADFCAKTGGRLDVLFNNAGVGRGGVFSETPRDVHDLLLDVNLKGVVRGAEAAYAYLKAGSIFLLILPALHVFPLLAILLVLLGVMVYYKETRKAEELVREKREQIEGELYRFVSTITQELKNSRDVLSMLEHYKENAGEMFQKELDIVCADMRSSSYEAALTRFEARLNSPQLSDVVRGLIGVLRGDDGAVYFQMLTHDFKQAELQRLKAKAAKIPPKIRVFSFAMLLCFLATYFAIIGYEIIKSMGTLF